MDLSVFPTGSLLAAYLRDSGGDEQDLSIPQQIHEVERWCQEHGYFLTRVFRDEARSGTSLVGRDAFLEMMRYFRSGLAQEAGIIVWKFSRLARDFDDASFFKADLRRRGYAIHSLNDTIPPGLDGRFFESAIDWMNARFSEDLSIDVKRGLRDLVEQYGAVPGVPPRGFKREPITIGSRRNGSDHIVHRWIPDPDLVHKVRQAFQMRAVGSTYKQITEATGLYKSNNSWTTFFRNKLYLGILEFGDLVINNYCTPLVDRAIWDEVQARRREHIHPRRKASNFLLSGLAFCNRCDAPLNGHVIKHKGSDDDRWEYYTCSRRKRRKDCDAPQIPKKYLEEAVKAELKENVLSSENLAAIQIDMRKIQEEQDTSFQRDMDALNRDLAKVRKEIQNVVNAIAELGHSSSLLAKLQKLEAEEQELLTASFECARRSPFLDVDVQILALRLARLIEDADTERLRAIYRSFIKKISIEREGKRIWGSLWYYVPESEPPPGGGDSNAYGKCPHGDAGYRHKLIEFAIRRSGSAL